MTHEPEMLVREALKDLLDRCPPKDIDRMDFLDAQFESGLAWVHFPKGLGGLGLSPVLQAEVDSALLAAGAPDNAPQRNRIGLGMAAPTILHHADASIREELLKPLWTGREIWCQLFSEPGAGSDLAAVATRARRDGTGWVIDGQKVWTSSAHLASRAILLARTDPDLPKHQGLTFFLIDMHDPGIEVRPLRQLTGEAEFNEVFLTGVRVEDDHRVGPVGDGWRIANFTLGQERAVIGGRPVPRGGGMMSVVAQTWRDRPDVHHPVAHDQLLQLWVESEAARLTARRLRQVGVPAQAAALKLNYARVAQALSGLEVEMLGEAGLEYSDWSFVRPDRVDLLGRDAGYRYLRAKGNSIEGGTSEILKNIISERVLGLPVEARHDKDIPWKETRR